MQESDEGNVTAPLGRHAEQTQHRTRNQSLSVYDVKAHSVRVAQQNWFGHKAALLSGIAATVH